MRSGTRPAQHLQEVRSFRFGAVEPASITDFCVDRGGWFPDQDAEGAPTECVGYKNADYMYDLTGTVFSPDFLYAAARYVDGSGAGVDGTSFHAGVEALVAVGAISALAASDFSAITKGELAISDFSAWSSLQKKNALQNAQNGVRNVLVGPYDAFDSILLAAFQTGKGISVGSQWYVDFNNAPGGQISAYTPGPSALWHNFAVKGKRTISGKEFAMVKWWNIRDDQQGDAKYWRFFDRPTLNALMTTQGAGALTIDPSANRWVALVGILIRRFPALLPELTQLIKAGL